MIDFREMLSPGRTRAAFTASSKKRALEQAADVIAAECPDLTARHLFDQLMSRERLGSTGLGEGVALPHCRFGGVDTVVAAFLHLQTPVDFDADDSTLVDLLFVLVVPEAAEGSHLQVLANVARVFGDAANRNEIRELGDDGELYDRLIELLGQSTATTQ